MELVTENPLVVVASVPAILALVNLLKGTFGIPGKWNALVAVLIGVCQWRSWTGAVIRRIYKVQGRINIQI